MATTPPTDTPFGLEPNIASGLAYILGIIGGLLMMFGGGTNKVVKWAAAQSITLFIFYFGAIVALMILNAILGIIHMWPLMGIVGLVMMVVGLGTLVLYVWGAISGFQGKDVRLPIVGDYAAKFFGSQLG